MASYVNTGLLPVVDMPYGVLFENLRQNYVEIDRFSLYLKPKP